MRRSAGLALLLLLVCACRFDGDTESATGAVADAAATDGGRVTSDVIALYRFGNEVPGEIQDISGFGDPLDLAVVGTGNYVVTGDGWNLTGDTTISSKTPALKLVTECAQTNALTIEVWIRPASVAQTGPARIVGMSANPMAANFVLAQGANNGDPESRFNARIRTANTTEQPASAVTPDDVVVTEWSHVVFTRAADETSALYINGEEKGLFNGVATADFPGALNNWDPTYTLNLGNELESTGMSRFWHGEFALLAIYRRDLSATDVTQNFNAGR